jgi:hypothetical protein
VTDKKCIFDDEKVCDSCGECEICDLDCKKVCDDCGKCLGESDYETKALKIDGIFEEEGELEIDPAIIEVVSSDDNNEEEDAEGIELIDDIQGLRELLENKNHSEKYTFEEFPGFIRFKKDME